MDGVVCFNDAALHAHYSEQEAAEEAAICAYHCALDALDERLPEDDFADALFGVLGEIALAIKTGRAELVGAVVIAARAAYIEQSATKEVYGHLSNTISPKVAAQAALAGVQQ